ncbi:MAG: glycosyltransferase family 4 protein [Actinobacteria bacterium]|nr:MAG: glycosyltransferase family 4 protein [Actinomycetota bacterium]
MHLRTAWRAQTSSTRTTAAPVCSAESAAACAGRASSIPCTGCRKRSRFASAAPRRPFRPESRGRAWNGCCTAICHSRPHSRASAHDDGRALVAGAVTNLEVWKGIDLLLEAAALARSPVRLEIYGTGSQRDSLERQARELGVDTRFHGFVADLRKPLAGLDVLVQPSRADNFPLAVLEAMAAGLPIVGARVGGIPELVLDGETGLLVEPEDAAALAAALDSLAESRERREALGRRARERVAESFSVDAFIRRTIELYEELCGSST